MTTYSRNMVGLILLAVSAHTGCKQDPPQHTTADTAKSVKTPVVDPAIGAAIAATSSTAGAGSADGPPPTGVFLPAEADARHMLNKPTKITLGSQGEEPRVVLGTQAPAGAFVFRVTTLTGPRNALPNVDLKLKFVADKEKASGDALRPPTAFEVINSVASKDQLGALPPQAGEIISALKGARWSGLPTPSGGVEDLSFTPPAKPIGDMVHALVGASEAFFVFDVPAPPKPVGAGAVWIAETRHKFTELDVISYRMYRVIKVDHDTVQMSAEVKQYVCTPDAKLPGVPDTAKLDQYESLGQAQFTLSGKTTFARQGRYSRRLTMVFVDGEGDSAQRLTAQHQSDVLLNPTTAKAPTSE